MSFYFAKTPTIVQRIFSNYNWSFSTSKKIIYLTFDDGPTTEITEWTLKTLKEYNAKATFFCVGKNIKNHPEIVKKIITDTHSIGNHTHNHLNGWKTDNVSYLENTIECEKTIQQFYDATIHQKLFRPPYGKIKPSQAKKLRAEAYKIILWDVLSADFDPTISKEKCLKNVLKNTKNGSVIVFHDSVKAKENLKYVLPKVLAHFSGKGFSFQSISKCE
jgi:peptidoglycan/xylan/chitin deacetylase (PgdA/CDA1 family)